MLILLFWMICGCADVNYQSVAENVIKTNHLDINKTALHKRMVASKECKTNTKTVDALASFGILSIPKDDSVVVLTGSDTNATHTEQNSTAFAISKMYEYGYKLEAKKLGMELLSTSKVSFALLCVMGNIYETEGDYRGATLFYIDALNFEPKNEYTNYALARLYYLQKKQKQAMKYAKIALGANGLEQKNISDLMMKIEKMHSEDESE